MIKSIPIISSFALCLGLCLPSLLESSAVNESTHQNFADELTDILYKNENEFSSTLGVSMVFSLIYPGSTGEAQIQIRDVLGYPSSSSGQSSHLQLVWEETTIQLDTSYDGQCDGMTFEGQCQQQAPTLEIANSVWFDDERSLDANYSQVVGDYAKQIDFNSADSPVIVNTWVQNHTNGLIDSVVPENGPLYPPYILIAINSIYLKASWENPFPEQKINLDSFYSSVTRQTEVSQAHFMHAVFDSLSYSHEALTGYQIVQLPFANSDLSMIFVLPTTTIGSGGAMSSDVISALSRLAPTRVALALPKFKFESKYEDDLKEALISIGIVAPFSGDLCGIFGDCGPFIDKIIQKTYIDVNERGVEAAAVTVAFGVVSAPIDEPILMVLDHPFQFFIYDSMENLVIFEGRLGAPEIGEPQQVELLSSRHSESDFWFTNFFVNPVDPIDSLNITGQITDPPATTPPPSASQPSSQTTPPTTPPPSTLQNPSPQDSLSVDSSANSVSCNLALPLFLHVVGVLILL